MYSRLPFVIAKCDYVKGLIDKTLQTLALTLKIQLVFLHAHHA